MVVLYVHETKEKRIDLSDTDGNTKFGWTSIIASGNAKLGILDFHLTSYRDGDSVRTFRTDNP